MTAEVAPPTEEPAVADETPREPNHRGYEIAVGVVVTALGALGLLLASGVVVARDGQVFGPRWWPTALAVAMMIIGVVLVIQAVLSRVSSDEPRITRSGAATLTLTIAVIVGYGFAWQYFDFRAVTALLLAGLTFAFGGRGVKALIVFPVATTLVLWAVFGLLLQVPL